MVFNVFTVAEDNHEPLRNRIQSRFPSNYYEISPGEWLVSHAGTAKEVFITLFPEPEFPLPAKNVVIFGVVGYWGFLSKDVWEWIAAKLGG
jgi:hypothetical protein